MIIKREAGVFYIYLNNGTRKVPATAAGHVISQKIPVTAAGDVLSEALIKEICDEIDTMFPDKTVDKSMWVAEFCLEKTEKEDAKRRKERRENGTVSWKHAYPNTLSQLPIESLQAIVADAAKFNLSGKPYWVYQKYMGAKETAKRYFRDAYQQHLELPKLCEEANKTLKYNSTFTDKQKLLNALDAFQECSKAVYFYAKDFESNSVEGDEIDSLMSLHLGRVKDICAKHGKETKDVKDNKDNKQVSAATPESKADHDSSKSATTTVSQTAASNQSGTNAQMISHSQPLILSGNGNLNAGSEQQSQRQQSQRQSNSAAGVTLTKPSF